MTKKQTLGRVARIGSAVTLAVVAAACGDDPDARARIDIDDDSLFAGSEATLREGDLYAANTENGAIRLGLTRERVYFELSEQVREHVDSEIESGIGEAENRIARSIGAAVRRGIAGAMEVAIDYRVAEIRDVDYRDGELIFDFVNPDDGRTLSSTDVDDEPITRAFAEEDARAFVAAFRRLKSDSVPAADAAAGGTADDGSF